MLVASLFHIMSFHFNLFLVSMNNVMLHFVAIVFVYYGLRLQNQFFLSKNVFSFIVGLYIAHKLEC
jgi:hypothetical protein